MCSRLLKVIKYMIIIIVIIIIVLFLIIISLYLYNNSNQSTISIGFNITDNNNNTNTTNSTISITISKIREKFLSIVNNQSSRELFDPKDTEMVGHKDWWIERFLLDTNNREDEALDRLVSTMKWRKQSGVNQLTARSFPAEMYRIGGLVRFCRDRNDRPVLWIQTFRHRPCSQWSALAKQFIVYQLELIDRESISHSGWSMIADTSQLSMANMDIGYSNFMINCLQQHYPGGVRYLLNIDLPWYMNLAVAVIIGFMDQHLRSIYRSVTSEELTDYLSADSIPVRLGGNYNRSLITVPDGVQTLADGFGHMFTRKQIADIQETFVDELNESN